MNILLNIFLHLALSETGRVCECTTIVLFSNTTINKSMKHLTLYSVHFVGIIFAKSITLNDIYKAKILKNKILKLKIFWIKCHH